VQRSRIHFQNYELQLVDNETNMTEDEIEQLINSLASLETRYER
jgi:hypothetical protein